MKLLPLLPLAFLIGCATAPTPKYSVLTPEEHCTLPDDYTRITVRLADDIRSAPNPLCFHADGRVTLCRELTYYAPLELAINRALNDTFSIQKDGTKRRKSLQIVVNTFGVDACSGTPKACVHLEIPEKGLNARVEQPLPATYTAQDLRDALGEALLQSTFKLLNSSETN